MEKLLAFHNDLKIKEKYLARVKAHAKADEIIHGTYWENGKGCAVGCTIHSNNHLSYEKLLGIPEHLAHLEDYIFENLSNSRSKTWPIEFLSSINVGSDLSKVWPKFAIWILTDKVHGVNRFDKSNSCNNVAKLYEKVLNGEVVSISDWESAESAAASAAESAAASAARSAKSAAELAAWSAAELAAWSAAASAAASAARSAKSAAASAAWSAKSAAASAAASAARSAAELAAWSAKSAAIIVQADKLLQLLQETEEFAK